jgi:hypothetical protein
MSTQVKGSGGPWPGKASVSEPKLLRKKEGKEFVDGKRKKKKPT